MRYYFIAAIFFMTAFSVITHAATPKKSLPEKKGVESINRATAEAHIGFLASDQLQGREASENGGKIAGDYIISILKQMGLRPLFNDYDQPFDAYRAERQKKGQYQIHPDSIAILKEDVHQKLSMRNILAKIDGKNSNEIIIIGAHYDHLGMDKHLEGDKIYNGADDNASGVSAVLQVARAFLATDVQPERTVIFAFWDGEEKGLLGSRYFTMTYPELNKVKGYLNYDMIGRNKNEQKPKYVVYFYTASKPIFGEWLKKDIETYRLQLEPDYRSWDNPVGGSDNGSFAKAGIPIIWYHTDGHADYHMPGDSAEKINYNKVVDITKASFLNMWNLANAKY
jgi:hypothetical protein